VRVQAAYHQSMRLQQWEGSEVDSHGGLTRGHLMALHIYYRRGLLLVYNHTGQT
jgi:hypothetical protein